MDFSKERLTPSALEALVAHARDESASRSGSTRCSRANASIFPRSDRRCTRRSGSGSDTPVRVGGADVIPAIRDAQRRMRTIAESIRAGTWPGATGKSIRDVVSIGIGGSDLGPRLVCDALAAREGGRCASASCPTSIPAQLSRVLARLDPATHAVRRHLEDVHDAGNAGQRARGARLAAGELARRRRLAASRRRDDERRGRPAPSASPTSNVLPMWDWVGGRYSLWSAVGLPHRDRLRLRRPSTRCSQAPRRWTGTFARRRCDRNLPLLLALVDLWNARWLGHHAAAVRPLRAARSALCPLFLQQLVTGEQRQGRQRATARRSNGRRRRQRYGAPRAPIRSTRSSSGCTRATMPCTAEFVVPVRARTATSSGRRCSWPMRSRRRRRC